MDEEDIPVRLVGSGSNKIQKRLVEVKVKDMKVKNFLFQAIYREILETILDKGTSEAILEFHGTKVSRMEKSKIGTTSKKGVQMAYYDRKVKK